MTAYTTVYDLISHPEQLQPPYAVYAFWLFVSVMTVALAVHAVHNEWRGSAAACVLAAILVIANGINVIDFQRFQAARQAIVDGDYATVEGCLDNFRPGKLVTRKRGHEKWDVGGETFSYARNQHGFGYNLVYPRGGWVAPDTRVRVAYLKYVGANRIIRLDVIRHACPAAPWKGW